MTPTSVDLRGNPLAPAWRLPSFEQPYAAERYIKDQTFTVAAGSYLPRQLIELDGDGDMIIDELAFDLGSALPGVIQARIQTGDGLRMSYDLLTCEEIAGPMFPMLGMKARSRFYVDLQNTGLIDIAVQVQFKGWKQYQKLDPSTTPGFGPETYTPLWQRYSTPPDGWRDEPFDYYFELPATGLQRQLGIPLALEDDAVFFARGLAGVADGAGAQQFVLFDPYTTQLSSDYVAQDAWWGSGGIAAPFYPEIVCPPGSVLMLNAKEYLNAATTGRFAVRGVKRVPDTVD